MEFLIESFQFLQWQQVVMWIIGGLLIFLAIKKEMEPTLLLPMGFGAILVNLPLSGAINQGDSHERQPQKSPSVEAIPFPPLKPIVTGKICPTTTKSPQ